MFRKACKGDFVHDFQLFYQISLCFKAIGYRNYIFNPNKTGLFAGSFFWAGEDRGQFDTPVQFISQEEPM